MLILQKILSIAEDIHKHFEQQIDLEQEFYSSTFYNWTSLGVIATVKLFASLGVSFRGHRENI